MKLYLIHCGFYDPQIFDGLYELHGNFFVTAGSVEEAKQKAKLNSFYKEKKMHIDGVQEILAVDGFRLDLQNDPTLNGETSIISHGYRSLKPPTPPEISA